MGVDYLGKELLREVYATRSVKEARRRLLRFYRHCRESGVPELARLAKTVRAWEAELLAWHDTGLTNAATEGENLLIKKIKRVGHGFRNVENYRLRLLLHCGVSWTASGSRVDARPSTSVGRVEPRWWTFWWSTRVLRGGEFQRSALGSFR